MKITLCTVTLGVLILFAAACGDDTSTKGAGGGGSQGGGGAGGGLDCSDPATTPAAPCGTLSFAESDVHSRKRNHHVTLLAETAAGTFIYVVGGANGNSVLDETDRYAVHADGSLEAGTAQTPLPVALGGMTGQLVSNVVLIAGGTRGSQVSDAAYAAVIGADGSLGAWADVGSVAHPRMHPASVAKDDTIYVMGGFDDPDVWDDIVKATVSSDGAVSAWTSAGALPGKRSHFAATRVGDYVYLTGGLEESAFSNPPFLATTWRGHFLSDGTIGEWAAGPDLPVQLATHASFFYGGYLYVGGGISNPPAKQEKRMFRAAIGDDHALGAWEETTPLLVARGHVHQFPVYKNHVYSFAGALDFNLSSTDEIDIGTFE